VREQVLSYELTLPQRIYSHLDRLFSVFKNQVNSYIPRLWNEKGFELLSQKGSAMGILKEVFSTPQGLPSRVFRNVLELTGQIVRSQIKRKEIFESLLKGEEVTGYDENFLLNVKRQLEKLKKKGKEVNSYFDFPYPKFNGQVVITSADDNLEKGQFKRLRISGSFLEFSIKVPTQDGWKWIKVRKLLPNRLRKALLKAKKIEAPLIKKQRLKSGYTVYRLVIPLSFEVTEPKEIDRVLALDLSSQEKRLGVAVIMDKEFVSKPIFFKTELIRKVERIYKETCNLERKIDDVYNAIRNTGSRKVKQELAKRLNHLFGEQKRKQRKCKELRKQILENFTNFVIAHAKAYHCQVIAIENLAFKEVPNWQSSKALRLFTQWFYSRFTKRLEEKARVSGLKVLKINPANTSRICAKCGKEGRLEKLTFECSCGTYDRDYNASLNVAQRALRLTKSRAYTVRDIPGRIPSRLVRAEGLALLTVISLFKLLAWLKVVQTCYLKPQNLIRWINSDKYD